VDLEMASMRTRNMNVHIGRTALALLLTAGLAARSHAVLSASWTGTQEIPDNDPNGVAYSFNLSDPATTITSVSVTLSVSGGWNGDLYAYLSNGSGYAVLLNRVGLTGSDSAGYGNPGFEITLSSGSSSDIHLYQTLNPQYNGNGQLTGTWGADGRFINPASDGSAFDSASRDNTLSIFNSQNPNGTWTLFIADSSGGEISTLTGWSVDVTAIPEPGSLSLLLAGALTLGGVSLRRLRRRQPDRP
jgi:subtilisin-like proprotein convertase family protein